MTASAQRLVRNTDPLHELRQLRDEYTALPPPAVRYRTRPGVIFLNHLHAAKYRHTKKILAQALAVSDNGLEYMLKQPLSGRRLVQWPSADDIHDLRIAWKAVRKGHVVARWDPAFAAIHDALHVLLVRDFHIYEIALAAGIPVRRLHRFTTSPMPAPDSIARAIRTVLPDIGQ